MWSFDHSYISTIVLLSVEYSVCYVHEYTKTSYRTSISWRIILPINAFETI